MTMPTGRDRAFGTNYDPKRKLGKPASMFHETGNKKHALDRMKSHVVIPEYIRMTPKREANDFGWMCNQPYVYSEIDELTDRINNVAIVDSKFTGALAVQTHIRDAKKKRSVKRIDIFEITQQVATSRPCKVIAKCQAVTMSNTPCKFKATCGNFCSKHKIIT